MGAIGLQSSCCAIRLQSGVECQVNVHESGQIWSGMAVLVHERMAQTSILSYLGMGEADSSKGSLSSSAGIARTTDAWYAGRCSNVNRSTVERGERA